MLIFSILMLLKQRLKLYLLQGRMDLCVPRVLCNGMAGHIRRESDACDINHSRRVHWTCQMHSTPQAINFMPQDVPWQATSWAEGAFHWICALHLILYTGKQLHEHASKQMRKLIHAIRQAISSHLQGTNPPDAYMRRI